VIGLGDGLRRGAWLRRGVRKRGAFRKRHIGPRQTALMARFVARRWAAKKKANPYVDGQREVDAPYRDQHGRGFWYPLEVFPVGCTIESTVRVSGGNAATPGGLSKRAEGRANGVAGFIMLNHIDPFRRKIACRTAMQARVEAERHGCELADGPGTRQ